MIRISKRATFRRSSWSDILPWPNKIRGLCLIIDPSLLPGSPEQALRQALDAGVTFIQYRSKNESRKKIYETALQLARTTHQAGAGFIVNDHADIAAAVDADGVHLGQDDLPIRDARKLLGDRKIIGISTHSIEQAKAAEAAGADYVGFGPIFPTATKDAGVVQGVLHLSMITKSVSIPVIAIGGINHANIQDVMRTGAAGAAVISAVLSASDIRQAAQEMLRLIQNTKN
jgi:thiamine-phosphate pyrophosphorylase